MARREVNDRQFSLYFPSVADKERWRKLAKPYTLNHWIMLMVEKAIEDKPAESSSDEVNALRKRNLELEHENKILATKLKQSQEVKGIKGPLPLDKQVVDLLKSGGYWPSTKIIKELKISAEDEGEMATADGEDGYRDMNDELNFENPLRHSLKIEEPLVHHILHIEQPSSSERSKAINNTLEQLRDLNLVEFTWQGWKWIK